VEFKGDVRDLRLRTSEVSEVVEVDAKEAFRYPLTLSMRYTLMRMAVTDGDASGREVT